MGRCYLQRKGQSHSRWVVSFLTHPKAKGNHLVHECTTFEREREKSQEERDKKGFQDDPKIV